jgi:hypothetical protein
MNHLQLGQRVVCWSAGSACGRAKRWFANCPRAWSQEGASLDRGVALHLELLAQGRLLGGVDLSDSTIVEIGGVSVGGGEGRHDDEGALTLAMSTAEPSVATL